MLRHTLDTRTVAQLVRARRGGFSLIRARYVRAMLSMGYSEAQAVDGYGACWDMAELQWAMM